MTRNHRKPAAGSAPDNIYLSSKYKTSVSQQRIDYKSGHTNGLVKPIDVIRRTVTELRRLVELLQQTTGGRRSMLFRNILDIYCLKQILYFIVFCLTSNG